MSLEIAGAEIFSRFLKSPTPALPDPGVDSHIHITENGLFVLKFYDVPRRKPFKEGQLEHYQGVTNLLSAQSISEDWTISIANQSFPFRITPFPYLVFSQDHNCWVGICPFIEGKRVDEGQEPNVMRQTTESLRDYSRLLCKIANVEGIHLTSINVKLTPTQPQEVAATDISVSIANLEPRS